MGSVIPKIKKKVSSYINNETGRISKQSLITIGAFMGTAAIATLATTTPTRATVTATLQPEEGNPITLIGSHSSHDSHSSAHSSACGEGCGECKPKKEAGDCTADYECGTCMSVCQHDFETCGECSPISQHGCTNCETETYCDYACQTPAEIEACKARGE